MALQISSGAGNTPVVAPLASPSATPAAGTGTQAPPQYQLDFNGLTRSAAVGLANPTNLGDLEIMFSQIAAALKDKLGDLAQMDDVSRAETLRGVRGLALSAFTFMADMSTTRDINEVIARDKKAIRDQAKQEKEAATNQREPLTKRQGELEGLLSGAGKSISASQKVIDDLTPEYNARLSERASLKLPEQQTRYDDLFWVIYGQPNGLYTRIAAANDNIAAQNTNIGIWNDELKTLKETLSSLDTKISSLEKTESDAEKSRSEAQTIVNNLTFAMQRFFRDVSSFLLGANNITQGQAARNAGEVMPEGETFDALIANLAKALVDLTDAMFQNVRSADIIETPGGSGLSGTDATPDRFGQMSAPVARAVAFAGLVGATMSALAEVLRNLAGGLAMQTAGELATAGQPRLRVGL